MKISLIISVYKRSDFLEKILATIQHQSLLPTEVIVAEDGQNESIKSVVLGAQQHFPTDLLHVSQLDNGNRKTLCVNKAIAKSKGDYIVTIDGDCLLHKNFIAAHAQFAQEEHFLCGRRVELSKKASEFLTLEKIQKGYLNGPTWRLYLDALFGETHHLGRFFQTPFFLRQLLGQNSIFDIRGCNFSAFKQQLETVNGYDNEFSGAYGEDSDLEYRLKNAGFKMKSVRGAAIEYHLWHPQQKHDDNNQKRLLQTQLNQTVQAQNGLKQAESIL